MTYKEDWSKVTGYLPTNLIICPYLNKPLQKETIVFQSCIFRRWLRLFPPSLLSVLPDTAKMGDRAWWGEGGQQPSAVQVESQDKSAASSLIWINLQDAPGICRFRWIYAMCQLFPSIKIGLGNLQTPHCGLARWSRRNLRPLNPLDASFFGTCPTWSFI